MVDGEYGGHDTPSGTDTDRARTSATCVGALGIGYYHADPGEKSDRRFTSKPPTQRERADLQHFAEESAVRHGCRNPAALP